MSAVCFFEGHSISTVFYCHCFSALYSNDQAHRQEDAGLKAERAGGRRGKRGGEPAFGVRFLLTRLLQGDDSWRNAPLIPITWVT